MTEAMMFCAFAQLGRPVAPFNPVNVVNSMMLWRMMPTRILGQVDIFRLGADEACKDYVTRRKSHIPQAWYQSGGFSYERIRLIYDYIAGRLNALQDKSFYKSERVITSMQSGEVTLDNNVRAISLCANNYLGLADHLDVTAAAHAGLDRYGFGLVSVRFICGTRQEHKLLETRIARFLSLEGSILYAADFDANAGLFETLLDPEDAIISDALNHASIIDGVRLCKAQRHRYAHSDMADLERCLQKTSGARHRLIATDGMVSMDGYQAPLDDICDLADRYDAMVIIDDCHSTAFVGPTGRGTAEQYGVLDRVDIITGTLGRALGGASGGFTAASAPVVDWLRQRSRPYLFSNTLAPVIAAASLAVFDILENGDALPAKLWENAAYFRGRMGPLGFELLPGEHAIILVMFRDPSGRKKWLPD